MNKNTIDVIVEILTEFDDHENNDLFKTLTKQQIQQHPDDPKWQEFNIYWSSREAAMRPSHLRSFLNWRKDLVLKLEQSFKVDEKQLESKVKKTLDEELKKMEKTIPVKVTIK